MVGTAIGAAMEGMRPIVEMQFADFSSIALNQILNNAGTQYWRTNIPCPITVRLPSGGTKGSGPFHSQSMEAIYSHYPGLVVVAPATVEDAYTMLIDAVAIDDPVIYCEHKYLYYHLKADALPKDRLPIGKARIVRPGRDLSIVTYSAMVHEALAVAKQFSAERRRDRSGRSAQREAARYRYRARLRRADGAVALRGRIIPLGRRDGRNHRACRDRRVSSARRGAGAHQRQRHADPLSSESLERASPEREDRLLPKRARFWPNNLMPKVPITMPQLGESMAEATIVAIKVQPGDKVAADQEIIEVETDKAVMGVTTPCPGEIAKIDAEVKGIYAVGAVLGYVEASEADAARFVKNAPEPPTAEVAKRGAGSRRGIRESSSKMEAARISKSMKRACRRSQPVRISRSIRAGVLPVPASAKGAGYLSPRVKARMAELQLTQADLAAIQGSGNAGRVTIKDLGIVPRRHGETNRGRRERDPHRRGRCDEAQLDAAARHGGRFRLSRSGAGRSRRSAIQNQALLCMCCARSLWLWRERRLRPRV